MKSKYIDLHVHTNFSDGCDDIATAIQKAVDSDVGVISFTEHYNVSSYQMARKYAGQDLEVIPGIEIGADMSKIAVGKKHICHILGYFVSSGICKLLDEYEMDRYECALKTLELLKKHKINLKMQEVIPLARDKKSIGRYDIAMALSYYGFVSTVEEAYGVYLDHGGKSYVSRNKLQPTDLVEQILSYGGVPVLAHPKSLHLCPEDEKSFIQKLAFSGLCGIEVYNPNNTDEQREYYLDLCKEYGLIATVGSDYHGGHRKPEIIIGHGINHNLCVSDMEIVSKLKRIRDRIQKIHNTS